MELFLQPGYNCLTKLNIINGILLDISENIKTDPAQR